MLRLILATYLWAVVMALGVWDYYLIKFPPCYLPEIYQEVLMPVVKVRTGISTGSGVIIETTNEHESTQIYVLTAAHVVGNQSKVQVIYYSYHEGTKAPSCLASCLRAFVVMTDTVKDLALLRLNPSNLSNLRSDSGVPTHSGRLRSAKLAPKDYKPYLFTEVYAVGCSLGLNPRPSEGIITAVGPDATVGINSSPGARYLEISAPILPGNSGGGVFLKETRPNDRGHSAGQAHELIGIVVWVRVYRGQMITTMAGVVPIQQIYEFLSVVPQGGLGADFPPEADQPLAETCWSGRGSECAIGIRGPGGPTLLTKGGEKSWQ